MRGCGMDMDWRLNVGMAIPSIELELGVLIRHGQTKWNVEHRYLGHTDIPLLTDASERLSQLSSRAACRLSYQVVFGVCSVAIC